MSTIELKAQIDESLKLIEEDETLLLRVAKYLKRLTKKKEDPTLMTKEEFFAKVDKALAQAERGETVRVHGLTELNNFLNSL